MDINDWKTAGRVAGEALEFGKSLVKKDASVLDVANKIEDFIRSKGCIPAFPVNISFNEVAAHSTAKHNDDTKFSDQLVKLDVGVCFNGAIGDTAATIDLSGKYSELVAASQEALDNALKILKPGITLGEIGAEIEKTIFAKGFKPVVNLSGHGLGEYEVHKSPSIPNHDNQDNRTIEKGDVFAIEPFASTGAGMIYESGEPLIFMLENPRPVRDMTSRQLLNEIVKFKGLPFASRWLPNTPRIAFAIRELAKTGILHTFPPLVDKAKGMVSQAEHSVYMDEEPIVLTRL